MSNFTTNSTQPEGSQATIINQARKRSMTSEFAEGSGSSKKRRVNNGAVVEEEQISSVLPSPPPTPQDTSPAINRPRRRRRLQRVVLDAVPKMDRREAAIKREKQNREREARLRARVAKKARLEEQERLQREREHRRQVDAELNRLIQSFRDHSRDVMNDVRPMSAAYRRSNERLFRGMTEMFVPVVNHRVVNPQEEELQCSICLQQFSDNEPVSVFRGCNHRFHTNCLTGWLLINDSCPNCRNPTNNIRDRF
ncbi:hypothetical protein K501DRAFT_278451 [Backusella circina FSU 941]|nr:hypothetical protein K501DRAFT_278451 [Backusella circina FSU 941]